MKTGIPFFDEVEFQLGEVIVLASGPWAGRSSVTRSIATGLAKHTDGEVVHVNPEFTETAWANKVRSATGEDIPVNLSYHLNTKVLHKTAPLAVVIDPLHLVVSSKERDEFMRELKNHTVCEGMVVVIGIQLSFLVATTVEDSGIVRASEMPEWTHYFGDRLFYQFGLGEGSTEAALVEVPLRDKTLRRTGIVDLGRSV